MATQIAKQHEFYKVFGVKASVIKNRAAVQSKFSLPYDTQLDLSKPYQIDQSKFSPRSPKKQETFT